MTRMIASVASVGEALLALHEGADIIDLMDPDQGTMGLLDAQVAKNIATIIAGRRPLCFCTGDHPELKVDTAVTTVRRMVSLEPAYIKIGFQGTREDAACIRALAPFSAHTRLVGVVFADRGNSLQLLDALAEWGFSAAILDTLHKGGLSLRDLKNDMELALFVRRARTKGLLVGLSGRLAAGDVAPLLSLDPDFLQFRSALCRNGYRKGFIDATEFRAIRAAIPADQNTQTSPLSAEDAR